MSKYLNVKISKCQKIKCQHKIYVKRSKGQKVKRSKGQNVKMPKCNVRSGHIRSVDLVRSQ